MLSLESMKLKLLLYLLAAVDLFLQSVVSEQEMKKNKSLKEFSLLITTTENLIHLGDIRNDILAFAYKTMQISLALTRQP